MEEIELTKRRSNASRAATSLKNVNVKEIDNDNSSLKSQPFYTGSNSVDDGNNNDNELEEINDLKPNRNTLRERLKFKTPAVPLIRMILKGSIALLISLLFVYVDNPRNKIGRASTMVVTSTILSFPFRPLGVQFEATVTGCLGAIGGAAWSFLGMYLGNLARDPNISSPVQPKSSAVLSIIMYIGVFIVTYARVKFAQAYWATVYSSMVIAFALTQASVTPGFAPVVVVSSKS
ncbi:hypothetical protein BDF20DRAFT_58655 [Mycotypha africana]|uniref:uncharacterized protein n=1 Tax=Mycotypha africana TaxID=64632 RepID=UPI00230111E9|nr:uncharacterized protein BDF20DRAFT_58655 [Mycotypha africana]KAI8991728.1 hypothetical protein BDF20DRAFT_58655 [Mycotypha africana]